MESPNTPSAPKTSRRKVILTRTLLILGIVLCLAVLALLVAGIFFQKQITRQVLAAAAKNLKTELKVADADLNLFSNFPDAAVELRGVQLADLGGGQLLEAEKVSCRFALFSLFGKNVQVKSVGCSNGALALRTDARGKALYEIFKDDNAGNSGGKTPGKPSQPTQSAPEEGTAIALEHADFQDIELIYENSQTGQSALLEIQNAAFEGNFSGQKFNLATTGDCTVSFLESDSSRYLAGEKTRWSATLAVDVAKDLYDLQGVELTLGGNTFAVDGIVVNEPVFTDFNLKLASQEGDISMIFNLLPDEYHAYFTDFASTGNYSCNGSVKGRLSKTQRPTVAFSVNLRNGEVTSEKLQSPVRGVSLQAKYEVHADGSGGFDIANFQGNFGGQPLAFDLKINNLDDPDVDFRCHGTLPLAATFGLIDWPEITGGDGLVRVNSLTVKGKYADMLSMNRIPNVQASGDLEFLDAELTYNGSQVLAKTGRLLLDGNVFWLQHLALQVGKSDLALGATAANLLPVLFADSLNSADARLDFSANLVSKNLDFDGLFALWAVPKSVAKSVADTAILDSLRTAKVESRRSYTDKLRGTFDVQLGQYQYGKISGKNFYGNLAFDRNTLIVNGQSEVFDGLVKVDGEHHFDLKPWMKLHLTMRDVDLRQSFEQCKNFGQEQLKSENLRGRLYGRTAVWAYFDEAGHFLLDETHVLSDANVRQGELLDLKMLEAFSSYVHLEDLRHVRFAQLQNFFEVAGRRIFIPTMFIQSNALNLTLSGTHTFDNEIDYKIKVNAGQILLNKLKSHDADLDPLPAQSGWFNLYYLVRGTVDKYEMKKSKKTVKADFERAEGRKNEISAALTAEFEAARPLPPVFELPGAPGDSVRVVGRFPK